MSQDKIKTFRYDRERMRERTLEAPVWIHFGAGNLFRAFPARLAEQLLNEGHTDKGVIVVEGFDKEIVQRIYRPYKDVYWNAVLESDGKCTIEKVGSIAASFTAAPGTPEDWNRLKELFTKPSLQMVSFTITEKGYSLENGKGELLPEVEEDLRWGLQSPGSYMGRVTALLYERFLKGGASLALVSMDNCSENGDRLYEAVTRIASGWVNNGFCPEEFLHYLQDKNRVSYPITMIDKITPSPMPEIGEKISLLETEFSQGSFKVLETARGTKIAPFVNSEVCEYLVIEDTFPNGRPRLEKCGVYFTDRESVERVERMKVGCCLNPLHTALAICGTLLGYKTMAEAMRDEDLERLIAHLAYREGMPVLLPQKVIEPESFLYDVLKKRLPNPYMGDKLERIATDTSQKLGVRFGGTIKAHEVARLGSAKDLICVPLVFAAWLRYLSGTDDSGNSFTISPDRGNVKALEAVKEVTENFKEKHVLKEILTGSEKLRAVMEDENIWGVNLISCGLDNRVYDYYLAMNCGEGSVRNMIKRAVKREDSYGYR
ncbi:MAG: mannitol dehydrogenase family protein [Lachnospiraceae bacterium]|nr:mannitol dehydrogenase family protein [Lachnospiraceae bacterium]